MNSHLHASPTQTQSVNDQWADSLLVRRRLRRGNGPNLATALRVNPRWEFVKLGNR